MIHGTGVKITEGMIPNVAQQPELLASAVEAGKLPGQRLKDNYDRMVATKKM